VTSITRTVSLPVCTESWLTVRADCPGDPFDYSVLLWTRAVPTQESRIDVPMCVEYKVYSGLEGTGDIVSQGYALTNADVDYTVKVWVFMYTEGDEADAFRLRLPV
jgi:hypothetical protein